MSARQKLNFSLVYNEMLFTAIWRSAILWNTVDEKTFIYYKKMQVDETEVINSSFK